MKFENITIIHELERYFYNKAIDRTPALCIIKTFTQNNSILWLLQKYG
jgi:hypothetical protein